MAGVFKVAIFASEPKSKRGYRSVGSKLLSESAVDSLDSVKALIAKESEDKQASVMRITIERQTPESGAGLSWDREYKPRGGKKPAAKSK